MRDGLASAPPLPPQPRSLPTPTGRRKHRSDIRESAPRLVLNSRQEIVDNCIRSVLDCKLANGAKGARIGQLLPRQPWDVAMIAAIDDFVARKDRGTAPRRTPERWAALKNQPKSPARRSWARFEFVALSTCANGCAQVKFLRIRDLRSSTCGRHMFMQHNTVQGFALTGRIAEALAWPLGKPAQPCAPSCIDDVALPGLGWADATGREGANKAGQPTGYAIC